MQVWRLLASGLLAFDVGLRHKNLTVSLKNLTVCSQVLQYRCYAGVDTAQNTEKQYPDTIDIHEDTGGFTNGYRKNTS